MTRISRIAMGSIIAICGLSVALHAQEISVDAMPPVVVKTVPQSGDTNVDANLDEIKVTFSKDMLDGNWSWVRRSKGSFPKLAGEPRFLADKRTCVVKVDLEPNKTYVVWLNSERFMNFKDIGRRSAVPYLLVFKTTKK